MTVWQKESPGTKATPVANGVVADPERSTSFSWEAWFAHASPPQRAEAIGLALRQGVLYPNQLPPTTNGVKRRLPQSTETSIPDALTRFLTEKPGEHSVNRPESLQFFDSDLDELQKEAVARAIATPDIFLLQGLPGTGKSRVLAEVLRQAGRLRQRVLFLAVHAASVDVVLHRLLDHPDTLPIRFLEASEKPEQLPAWLHRFTLAGQERSFLERTLAGAHASYSQAETACRHRRERESLWVEILTCQEASFAVDLKAKDISAQLQNLRASVEQDLNSDASKSDLARCVVQQKAMLEQAEARLKAEMQVCETESAQCEKEISDLSFQVAEIESAYLAKKQGRFLTLAFWTNLFNSAIIPKMENLLAQQARARDRRQQIADQVARGATELDQIRSTFEKDRSEILETVIQERAQVLQKELQDVGAEKEKLEETWQSLSQRLGVGAIEKSPAGIVRAQELWQEARTADERLCQFAQRWNRFVEESGKLLSSRLPTYANVLAGTIRQWNTDSKFRGALETSADLLIVEDADELTEDEVLKLSRLAPRCILVGAALADPVSAREVTDPIRSIKPGIPVKSTPYWDRLWKSAGTDLARWPGAWRRENGRLICQLFPLSAEDRQHLESESLVGAPDIELWILHRPSSRPCLAQVIFAPNCSFAEAVAFMIREVQEFPLRAQGVTSWWTADARHLVCQLRPKSTRIHSWIEIETGVRLGANGTECPEAAVAQSIEFDRNAGWDRPSAEAWLRRHLALADGERKVFLQTPYRFDASIARLVQAVIRPTDWDVSATPTATGSVEFTAVRPVSGTGSSRTTGYELDLAESRGAESLPAGLRHGLPGRGFVNYVEAQTLIAALEGWARAHPTTTYRVAVLATYGGQVELLRRLVAQSELLRSRTFALEIGLPSAFRQREFEIVFLSLTRSNPRRAVPFSEGVNELPRAISCARHRLHVFGDLETLKSRASWRGPVETQGERDAEQEAQHLSRFLATVVETPVAPAPTTGMR